MKMISSSQEAMTEEMTETRIERDIVKVGRAQESDVPSRLSKRLMQATDSHHQGAVAIPYLFTVLLRVFVGLEIYQLAER